MLTAVAQEKMTDDQAKQYLDNMSAYIENASFDIETESNLLTHWVSEQIKDIPESALKLMLVDLFVKNQHLKQECIRQSASLFF
ncbi:hypothetical protein TCA2_4477 [Paenibacillus sp. TCA20]|uniref:Uncharacterized protein n=1 Tax=Paenibacillus urinalis TaxID=521520 RepID=A0ABY7XHV6_9BACL|nr:MULTISPECIES: hypothetical protein [Paenibacillus]WDI05188.1 hypothetical protein PUW25_25605 [Paenibacillus urinalis]GAK41985.1 hypothetical protein TCA2_4477 [Paenibacillus sp. TCA20]